jgi:hypothetical protein
VILLLCLLSSVLQEGDDSLIESNNTMDPVVNNLPVDLLLNRWC